MKTIIISVATAALASAGCNDPAVLWEVTDVIWEIVSWLFWGGAVVVAVVSVLVACKVAQTIKDLGEE